jgi:hypothetical protein
MNATSSRNGDDVRTSRGSQLRRLMLAIVAWPAGMLAALVLLFLPTLVANDCPPDVVCARSLESPSTTSIVLWLAVAFGPGILATRAWWKGRSRD